MKTLLLLCACLWALAAPLRAVAGPPDIVVVRITEYNKKVITTITTGEAKSEVTEFEASSYKTAEREVNENFYKLLRRFYDGGYALQSSTTIMSSGTTSTRVLVLTKN